MRALMLVLGAVVAALVVVSAQAGSKPPARALIFTPGSYDFGSVALGTSATQDFTLSYTGSGSSDVVTVTLLPKSTRTYTAPFTLIANGCRNKSLTAKTTCTVTVSYSPSAAGATDTATLKATSQDQPFHSNTVALSGEGQETGADIALAYTSPTTSPLHGIVTITNNGPLSADVTITVTATGTPCYISSIGWPPAWQQTEVSLCEYTFATPTPIASGDSAAIDLWYGFSGGTAAVTQSSQTDPNTANNSVTIPQFGTGGD